MMKRVVCILIFLLLACAYLRAATVPLTGTIRLPNGQLLNGSITLQLSYAVARDTTTNQIVVAAPVTFPVRNGALASTAQVVGNDVLQPRNTTYLVTYRNSFGVTVGSNVFYISGSSYNLGTAVPSQISTSN